MIATKSVIHVTDQSFEKVINNGLTLVDFWAEWCSPCRMQGPILDQIASESGDKVTIAKLNVDDNRNIAAKYNIMSIPTLILFKNGRPIKQMVGVQPKQILTQLIKENE